MTKSARPYPSSPRTLGLFGLGLALAATLAGCGTVKTTNTARTGTEQLLLTDAWDAALARIDFRPLTGVPCYLDTTNVTAVDLGWVVSSLKQAMLQQGVLLRTKAEQAQWVVEARVGAYGTDQYELLFGIPQTTIPMTITGLPAGTIPEMSLAKRTDQHGVVKMALFAYDRASGQLVWTSGTSQTKSNAKDVYVGGVGPIQSGTIRKSTEFSGMKIPVAHDLTGGLVGQPAPDSDGTRGTEAVPPPLPPSATTTDIDSFSP
ncbi:DUF6655 family protein [Paludisphaera mucosa]|uniref:Lipoprotein n=1 Tax=Paludisphaera mucosa TaxID=3030827 RepID=A0ABT6F740_9BACT|nr:DUF6655 family protein [Paludisphaera mucosa]MDG3003412.1 hypothetical protein [Paludisphaera mucosa]